MEKKLNHLFCFVFALVLSFFLFFFFFFFFFFFKDLDFSCSGMEPVPQQQPNLLQ